MLSDTLEHFSGDQVAEPGDQDDSSAYKSAFKYPGISFKSYKTIPGYLRALLYKSSSREGESAEILPMLIMMPGVNFLDSSVENFPDVVSLWYVL